MPYRFTKDHQTVEECTKRTKDGDFTDFDEPLANFQAVIITETVFVRGETSSDRAYRLRVTDCDGDTHDIDLTGKEFQAMKWPLDKVGAHAIVYTGKDRREKLREAIQLLSGKPERIRVYQETGWTKEGRFLIGSASIGDDIQRVEADLPTCFAKYDATEPSTPEECDTREDYTRCVLIDIACWPSILTPSRPEISIAALCYIVRTIIGGVDFAFHIAGTSGAFKTELAGLMLNFFGPENTAKDITMSWASTENVLELACSIAKDCLVVVDDFAPTKSRHHTQQLNHRADRLLRGLGNQAGRSRMVDGKVDDGAYPRCGIVSTGEDVPAGQSLRARMLIVQLAPGEIDQAGLTTVQQTRSELIVFTLAYIRWIQQYGKERLLDIIAQHKETERNSATGHQRTASIAGDLSASLEILGLFLNEYGIPFLDEGSQKRTQSVWQSYINDLLNKQDDEQEEESHHTRYISAIKQLFEDGTFYACSLDNTAQEEPPMNYEALGWRMRGMDIVHANHGQAIGYYDEKHDAILMRATRTFQAVQKTLAKSDEPIPITQTTLQKRLRDHNLLAYVDETRNRITLTKTIGGSRGDYVALQFSKVFPESESTTEDATDEVNVDWIDGEQPPF